MVSVLTRDWLSMAPGLCAASCKGRWPLAPEKHWLLFSDMLCWRAKQLSVLEGATWGLRAAGTGGRGAKRPHTQKIVNRQSVQFHFCWGVSLTNTTSCLRKLWVLTCFCRLGGAGHTIGGPFLGGADRAQGSQSSRSLQWRGLHCGCDDWISEWAQEGWLLQHNALMLLNRKITAGTSLSLVKWINEVQQSPIYSQCGLIVYGHRNSPLTEVCISNQQFTGNLNGIDSSISRFTIVLLHFSGSQQHREKNRKGTNASASLTYIFNIILPLLPPQHGDEEPVLAMLQPMSALPF